MKVTRERTWLDYARWAGLAVALLAFAALLAAMWVAWVTSNARAQAEEAPCVEDQTLVRAAGIPLVGGRAKAQLQWQRRACAAKLAVVCADARQSDTVASHLCEQVDALVPDMHCPACEGR